MKNLFLILVSVLICGVAAAQQNGSNDEAQPLVVVKNAEGKTYKVDDMKSIDNNAIEAVTVIKNETARAEFAQADFAGNKTNAFYALAGYHFEKPWSVVARYEFINDDYNVLNEDRITIGGVYKPYKFLRLQLNYSYTMNAKRDKNFNGINLMVSAIF